MRFRILGFREFYIFIFSVRVGGFGEGFIEFFCKGYAVFRAAGWDRYGFFVREVCRVEGFRGRRFFTGYMGLRLF